MGFRIGNEPLKSRDSIGGVYGALEAERVLGDQSVKDRNRGTGFHPGNGSGCAQPEGSLTVLEGAQRTRIGQSIGRVDELAQRPIMLQDDRPPSRCGDAQVAVLHEDGDVGLVLLQVVVGAGGKWGDLLAVVESQWCPAL